MQQPPKLFTPIFIQQVTTTTTTEAAYDDYQNDFMTTGDFLEAARKVHDRVSGGHPLFLAEDFIADRVWSRPLPEIEYNMEGIAKLLMFGDYIRAQKERTLNNCWCKTLTF